MADEHKVKGYDGFIQFIKDFKTEGKIVNVLFSGAKDAQVSLSSFYLVALGVIMDLLDFRVSRGVRIVSKLNHS